LGKNKNICFLKKAKTKLYQKQKNQLFINGFHCTIAVLINQDHLFQNGKLDIGGAGK
jgi:hypothetical protein